VIGPSRPFCMIGERINPTGRKAFQAQLQAGDLSQLHVDVAEQVTGGAHMLDVNVGDPLADEVELMRAGVRLVQELTDLPLCIDSSVIAALAAGLAAYEGKALVNSVTGEDERLEAILPLVARHGAAVIGLANDDEIRMEPQRRYEIARKIVSAAGDHGIKPEDVIIDALAMPIGAEPRAAAYFFETTRLIRDGLGVNTTCGASNTSFGMPGRHQLNGSRSEEYGLRRLGGRQAALEASPHRSDPLLIRDRVEPEAPRGASRLQQAVAALPRTKELRLDADAAAQLADPEGSAFVHAFSLQKLDKY